MNDNQNPVTPRANRTSSMNITQTATKSDKDEPNNSDNNSRKEKNVVTPERVRQFKQRTIKAFEQFNEKIIDVQQLQKTITELQEEVDTYLGGNIQLDELNEEMQLFMGGRKPPWLGPGAGLVPDSCCWSLALGAWTLVLGTGGDLEAHSFHQSSPYESYGGV